jgi:uncharacterized membrane protein
MTKLKQIFFAGIFVIVPIGLSIFIIVWLLSILDQFVAPVFEKIIHLHVPGMGLITLILVILGAGAIATNVLGQKIILLIEKIFGKLPAFGSIYKTTKALMQAFSPNSQASFKKVVLVEHPKKGTYQIGFITKETFITTGKERSEKMIAVYVPTNHLYLGDIFIFNKTEVKETNLSIQQGIQIILSAGSALPKDLNTKNND